MRRKIKCENLVCANTFYFDTGKHPNAKKVRCPKCKGIQALSVQAVVEEEIEDWLKIDQRPLGSTPNIPIPKEPEIKQKQVPLKDDFFSTIPPQEKKKAQKRQQPIKENHHQQFGWLVIHDEYTETHTFNLREGINRIGRKAHSTSRDINITIQTGDKYMSREHCVIEVTWRSDKNNYEYILSDRRSTNGTFVNTGRRLLPSDNISLKDSDTIQVGRTKLILKLPSNVQNKKDAEDWVRHRDYAQTIIT